MDKIRSFTKHFKSGVFSLLIMFSGIRQLKVIIPSEEIFNSKVKGSN